MPQKPTIPCVCDHCGKTVYKVLAEVKRQPKHYCDRVCQAAALRNRITVQCAECGVQKQIIPANVNASGNYFCNRACRKSYIERTATTITCANCGKVKRVPPSKANRAAVSFCSRSCQLAYYPGKSPEDKSKPVVRISLTCAHCGDPVQRKPSHAARIDLAFCSKACVGAYRSGKPVGQRNLPSRRGSKKIETACNYCGNPVLRFPSRIKANPTSYCSRECKHAALVKPDIHIERGCLTCGLIYSTTIHQLGKRGSNYCSIECAHAGRRKNPSAYSYYWRTVAPAIRKRDNYTCQVCGKRQTKPALDVHHIERAGNFGVENVHAANEMDNLITLCRSCHRHVEGKPELLRQKLAEFKAATTP